MFFWNSYWCGKSSKMNYFSFKGFSLLELFFWFVSFVGVTRAFESGSSIGHRLQMVELNSSLLHSAAVGFVCWMCVSLSSGLAAAEYGLPELL